MMTFPKLAKLAAETLVGAAVIYLFIVFGLAM